MAFRSITFLCPSFVTGGTEAMHQAARAIIDAGRKAEICYVGSSTEHRLVDGCLRTAYKQQDPCALAFADYAVPLSHEIRLEPSSLIVLPEVHALQWQTFRPASVGIWWLSVDNAFAHNPALADEATRKALFTEEELLHFYQSAYAHGMLLSNDATHVFALSDYTRDLFLRRPTQPNAGAGIMYNQKRGADLAALFFSGAPDLCPLPLNNMSAEALKQAYSENPVFIDFGNLPGKDRMPREAAACGALLFVHNVGAGQNIQDFPIPPMFKFDKTTIESGVLATRVRQTLQNRGLYWARQVGLRRGIAAEKRVLTAEVATAFLPDTDEDFFTLSATDYADLALAAVGP